MTDASIATLPAHVALHEEWKTNGPEIRWELKTNLAERQLRPSYLEHPVVVEVDEDEVVAPYALYTDAFTFETPMWHEIAQID